MGCICVPCQATSFTEEWGGESSTYIDVHVGGDGVDHRLGPDAGSQEGGIGKLLDLHGGRDGLGADVLGRRHADARGGATEGKARGDKGIRGGDAGQSHDGEKDSGDHCLLQRDPHAMARGRRIRLGFSYVETVTLNRARSPNGRNRNLVFACLGCEVLPSCLDWY